MGRDHSEGDKLLEGDRAKRHRKDKHRERSPSRASRHRDEQDRHSRRNDKERRHKDDERRERRDNHRSTHRRRSDERDKKEEREHRKRKTRSRSNSRPAKERRQEEQNGLQSEAQRPFQNEDKDVVEQQQKDKEVAELDDEAARRRQRVAIWQEQRRAAQQAEEAEQKRREEAAGPSWTLEDDVENEYGQVNNRSAAAQDLAEGSGEVDPLDAFMQENDKQLDDEDEVDPLDAFMANEIAPTVKQEREANIKLEDELDVKPMQARKPTRKSKYYDSDESSEEPDSEFEESDDEAWLKNVTSQKLSKSDKLGQVDHSTIDYPPFRRNFYIEAQELQRMTDKQLKDYRKSLDDIKVRGKDVPRPVKNWSQCGLSGRIMDVLKKNQFATPMAIQAQALPVIMSGRDCIGIAMTGSGKTLAYVLPLLRHIKAQRPLARGDGPIGLIMGPTRELVNQIGKDVKKFSKSENIQCVTIYGGSGVAEQITELKRGTEIVVCTPGRMIDILVTSGGKITNLRRVTYLVLDEADRMFDMGFEPQIMRIVNNIRPDRQTVMFSATFPIQVEKVAKQAMQAPVEIQVGGRSVVNKDITQFVEIRQPEERFMRLLEILGDWQEQGKILVFVRSQDLCDKLFRDLLQVSYGCLSLHGGKDQVDRESTINDFKNDVCSLLIATSVAARGLDVKDLLVVINYEPPDHHEDYVHRVGRTGRAGNKGTAYTFICDEEERYSPGLVKALQESGAGVPQDLQDMAENYIAKWKRGEAPPPPSGFSGHGFKFNQVEEEEHDARRQGIAKTERARAGMADSDDDEEDTFGKDAAVRVTAPKISIAENEDTTPEMKAAQERARKIAESFAKSSNWQQAAAANSLYQADGEPNDFIRVAQNAARGISQQRGIAYKEPTSYRPMIPAGMSYEAEIEVNDFPQHARWKVTHRDTLAELNERTGAAVTTKGFYQPPGGSLPEGERKIYLHIEGATEQVVKECKREIKRILEESTERALRRESGPAGGRYNI